MNSGPEILPAEIFDATTFAVLLESTLTTHDRHTWFGRAELVEKPAHDLHAHEFGPALFTLGKLQGGYVRQFSPWKGVVPGIGGTDFRELRAGGVVVSVLRPRRHGLRNFRRREAAPSLDVIRRERSLHRQADGSRLTTGGNSLFSAAERSLDRVNIDGAHPETLCQPL